jgi:hypothetical protein
MPTTYDGVPGNVTFPAPLNIASTSAANPTTITTSTAHNLKTGTKVSINGHAVNAGVNGYWTITNTGTNTFTIPVASSGDSSATGTVQSLRLGPSTTLPTDGTGGTSIDPANASSIATPLETIVDAINYLYWQLVANFFDATIGGTIGGGCSFGSSVVFNGPVAFAGSGFVQTSGAQQIVANFLDSISSQAIGGIQADAVKSIISSVVAGIQSGVAGGIALSGGNADWIRYIVTRSTTRWIQPWFSNVLGTGWQNLILSGGLEGPANGNSTVIALLPALINGSTSGAMLTDVELRMCVIGTHTGGVPAVMPTVDVRKAVFTPGSPTSSVSLFSGGAQSIPTPASGAAWYDSGNVQSFHFTPDQNNVIDLTTGNYYIVLTDENGANSQAGDVYLAFGLTFSGIANSSL